MALDDMSMHYDAGGIVALNVIRAKLTSEQYEGFLLGNVLKYAQRYSHKGDRQADARKMKNYSLWLYELNAEREHIRMPTEQD